MASVNIIVPIFNVEKFLAFCINSIIKQSFTDYEVTLIDDGAFDSCGAICDEFVKRDGRFTVIHKKNGGLSDARNTGIELVLKNTDCDWITFIDSDDWIAVDYLAHLYSAVVKSNCNVGISNFTIATEHIFSHNSALSTVETFDTEQFFCEYLVNAVVSWGKMFHRNLFVDIRFPVGKIHEDEFTTYKLLFSNKNIVYISSPLYYYYYNTNGISKQIMSSKKLNQLEGIFSSIRFLKKNNYYSACRKQLEALQYWATFQMQKVQDNRAHYRNAKRYLKKAIFLELKMNSFSLKKINSFYLKKAFPHLSWLYWTSMGILNKTIKKIHK